MSVKIVKSVKIVLIVMSVKIINFSNRQFMFACGEHCNMDNRNM